MNSLTQFTPVVNALTFEVITDETDLANVPNGVYEFDDPSDRWVVVIGGQAVNWATHQGTAWQQYSEAMRVNREHAQRSPDYIYFNGEPVAYESEADDYGLGGL